MSKVITAEYDAAHKTLQLVEPLEGVRDHETVQVQVNLQPDVVADPERPWVSLSGIMSEEDGKEFADAINEMFPPWDE